MVLNGSAFALTDGVIDFVQTTAWVCAGTVAPNSCTFDQAQESREFTSATLPAPVELIEGQHVTVRVSISFP
ncbi:MAG: hypothetical protein FJ319_07855 [SAR202 cluster bacterium]|nr:hypothetical protein [SAR202 cluster bacterium]